MAKTQLDQGILKKLAKKTGKKEQYLREQISRRAARQGITSPAAEILWARDFGIGTGRYLSTLPAHIQDQVRDGVSTGGRPARAPRGAEAKATRTRAIADPVRAAIDTLLSDPELRKRCSDLLKGSGPYDRAIREATTILDHRLKKLGDITGYMNPADVVGKVLSPDPNKAIIKVSTEAAEQEGMFNICKGLTLAFRGPLHHTLKDHMTRQEAVKFCGFIDTLLGVLTEATKASGGGH
jgi:Protein of unknown function (Hypoth_ymh)